MRRILPFLILLLGSLIALPTVASAQTDRNTRLQRLRDHERRIQEIIRDRRIARQQEEEEARRTELAEAEARGEDPRERTRDEREERTRTTSTVVMGFKFLNEEGVADYNMFVRTGETFLSEVYLFNVDQNPIERVRLALDYDKRFIEPVRIFDVTLRNHMEGEPDFRIDERDAIVLYDAKLDRELNLPEVVLLRILWRAVRPAPFTGIDFAFDNLEREDEAHTAIFSRGRNILGFADDPADGVLSGGLMINAPDGQGEILQGKMEELREIYLGSVASDSRVGLRLTGPETQVHAGDEFVVRVALNNPEGALIDSVSFAVLFDPEVLQVINKDQFNYINRGVNIHDGPYQMNFPWDIHKRNEVRNDRGLIQYQKGLSNGASLPSRTMAAIHFRAIAPASSTAIGLVKGRPGAPNMTSVRYFGYERLDLASAISEPSIYLSVMPRSAQVAATGPQQADDEDEASIARQPTVRSLLIER